MIFEETKALLQKCQDDGLLLRHKYLGLMRVSKLEEEQFYAKSDKGEFPFRYDEVGGIITVIKPHRHKSKGDNGDKPSFPKERNIPQTHDATLYGKHRRTLFVPNDESGLDAMERSNLPGSDADFEIFRKHPTKSSKKTKAHKQKKGRK